MSKSIPANAARIFKRKRISSGDSMETQIQAEDIVLAFTDVVNSVELTVQYQRIFLQAQDEHRRLIRDELAKWRGTEVKTTGDGFFLTFPAPLDAAQWAKETQRLMLKRPWPSKLPLETRIGLHWGAPLQIVHPDGRVDYDGEPVNHAARVMGEARGGQIFVSQAFLERAQPQIPAPFVFHALGLRDLKGYGLRPLWQMLHSDLPADISAPEFPSNLPFPPNAHFCGREACLAELRMRLPASRGGTVALTGMGGLGKTQIALEYAHAHSADYPGGMYWLDARSEERLLADYAAIGKQFFGLSESLGAEEAAEQTRKALGRLKKQALVIFDNVTEQTNLKWLPSSGPMHLLLTTQRQVLPAHVFLIEPPRLSESASLQLLQVFRSPADEKEREAAREIVRMVGNLPLALALASHHIRALGCSFPQYLQRLRDAPILTLQTGREYFTTATGHEGSIYDTIALAIRDEDCDAAPRRGVNEDALRILAAAACFASSSIPNDLLFQTSGIRSQEKFERALMSLWARSLLTRERAVGEEGRQFVHELVREYARLELLPSRRRAFLPRAVHTLTERLRRANLALDWNAVRNDMAHCYAVASAQTKVPPLEMADLLLEIGVFLAEHRDCKTALKYYADGLNLLSPGAGGLSRAKFLRLMGEAEEQEGDAAAALRRVRAAWRLARRELPKGAPEMADYCNSMGYVLKMRGQLKRALPFYLRALMLHQGQAQARQSDIAALFNNIGNLLEAQNDLPGAREQFQCALASAEKADGAENILIAYCLNNAGRVLGKMDCWPEALERHQRARKISEAAQGARHPNTAACWFYIAEAQRALGRRREALTNYRRAKRIYEDKFGAAHPATQRTSARLASLEAGEK